MFEQKLSIKKFINNSGDEESLEQRLSTNLVKVLMDASIEHNWDAQEALDNLVHDIAAVNAVRNNPHDPDHEQEAFELHLQQCENAASEINNAGMDAQLQYLKQHVNSLAIVEMLNLSVV